MLKGIPEEINPELLKAMCEMGHGDTILIADANYPAYSKGLPVIRADNIDVKKLLKSILQLFPLDVLSDWRAFVMLKDDGNLPECTEAYQRIIKESGDDSTIQGLARQRFYDVSKTCYVIVLTADKTPYANIILKKGTIN